MIRCAESENREGEKNESCVKHQSIKMEINRFAKSSNSLLRGLFFQHLNGRFLWSWMNIKMSDPSILFSRRLCFLSRRGGLQLSDISGAAYSQWCKERQHTHSFGVFTLHVGRCLLFFSTRNKEKTEKQETGGSSHHMHRSGGAGDFRMRQQRLRQRLQKGDERRVGNLLIILIILTPD